jgi:hypothetical protein
MSYLRSFRKSYIKAKHTILKQDRRNLLKLMLFGAGAFIAGKLFNNFTGLFSKDVVLNEFSGENFKVVESQQKYTLYGAKNEPLLIVEKDGYETE